MSRRWLLSLLCVSAALIFVQLSAANSSLLVNESATKFLIQDETIVSLEVVNPANQNLPVRLKLDLLDPLDNTRGFAVRQLTLTPGLNQVSVPLRLLGRALNEKDDKSLLWYRLSYRVDPSAPAAKANSTPDAAHGVISLSEIETPDVFSLEVSAPRRTHRGGLHPTHIRAFHPITEKPVKGVSVTVELEFDDDAVNKTLTATGTTDATGYALVNLHIPAKISAEEGELKVVAKHGSYVKEVSNSLDLNETGQILITTDKPIYQPGQLLHFRALVFDSSKRAAANAGTRLKIVDPENTTVFQTNLVTSRFGVVNVDWTIPETTRLGDYSILLELDDENYHDASSYHSVKISRYDLPNFTVNVKPDRSYYLPQQNANVEVRGEYLFGPPVKRGHVRVVREENRQWNFSEQKWDIRAAKSYEGEIDEGGSFVARIDLTKEHEDLADAEYSRYKDLHYAAYFTDPTTNRTEQRRFDLRVTKDAIHIYVAEGRNQQLRGFPFQFYLATAYADGSPAPCEVAISGPSEENAAAPMLRTIRTDKRGLAKVRGLRLPDSDDSGSSSNLTLTARDNAGGRGRHVEQFYFGDLPVIRVETDKALYLPNEVIKVNISASQPELNLIVDVRNEKGILESRHLQLHNGTATFNLRYRPEFQRQVTISAYSRNPDSYGYSAPFGYRTVLFPRDSDLKLDFRFDHADYKPGDEATVDFRVSTADGRPANSALGVVIFDRAVEERARTDQDFGGAFGFSGGFNQLRGYDNQVGGITLRDLQRLDLKQPLPEAIDLAAEMLLVGNFTEPEFFRSEDLERNPASAFARLTSLQMKRIGDLLDNAYQKGGVYATNGSTLRRLLFEVGTDFDGLRDPWGTPYREIFSIYKDTRWLDVASLGPDKQFGTIDDFYVSRTRTPYFRFTGEAIDRAVTGFHVRTGDFIRNAVTLKTELQSEGISFDSLRDPWGQPYQPTFTTIQNKFKVNVISGGPNKRLDTSTDPNSDDFTIWTSEIDYLRESRPLMEKALQAFFVRTAGFPRDDSDLRLALSAIEQNKVQDPWGNRYYAVFKTASYNIDRKVVQNFGVFGQKPSERIEPTPVTQQVSTIQLRSRGQDEKQGTPDDFDVASFSQITYEKLIPGVMPTQLFRQPIFQGPKGAIKGTVTDMNDATIAGVKVTATLKDSAQEFETSTDDEGRFLLQNLPVGYYTVRCDSPNFKSMIVSEVPVSSSNITTADFKLEAGSVTETVTVTAGVGANIDTTQSSVAMNVKERRTGVSIGLPVQLATPRLREYFPETLVWQPSLETDKQGRAQLKFKLADNITTWKMSVIGSTEDGEIGTAETEIKSFQPFFVEHDPPRVLTEGDQISLPVVLRNYLENPQTVEVEIKPEHWFTVLGPTQRRASVPAGDSAQPTFELQAIASVKDGKQRVTARGPEASDAIEKLVTVHPDGEERTQTAGDVFTGAAGLDLNLPEAAIPGSTRAELKVYPGLMAHVFESLEGVLERPHGCGEQTISSTYPSVLVLRRNKLMAIDSGTKRKAEHYAQLGYQRLLNYRTEDGGFSYWGHGEADLALTAYALRFLHDAAEFVAVDEDVVSEASQWLMKQQQADGSWGTALLTGLVARVLGMKASASPLSDPAGQQQNRTASPELQRALAYLSAEAEKTGGPYLIASYALAAASAGDREGAKRAAQKLRGLARSQGNTTYWSPEAVTPFYGWGLAGEIETTALAIQAIAQTTNMQVNLQRGAGSQATDPLVRGGLLFLLKRKDRYGVWYSTQATVNVLDTLMMLLAPDRSAGKQERNAVEVIINGQNATSLNLAADQTSGQTIGQTGGLLRADISRFLRPGANHIELRQPTAVTFASVQLVVNYYVPWSATPVTKTSLSNPSETSALRLAVSFDKTAAMINQEISCHVKAERGSGRGYGMMLAEIGLPPGAEVDRASLETATKNSGGAVRQYDILPDRVVVYLWPYADKVDFDFKFRPRFALNARAAPSVIYDYYNPDARAVVAPEKFVVK